MKQKIVLEQNPYVPLPYKVLDVHKETKTNFTLTVAMKVAHEPGQFVQVSLPGIGEAPISICSDSQEHIKLNINEVGNVTKALAKIRKGDMLLIRGPYGHGYPLKELKGNNIVIIGGGCGVAPLRAVIDYLKNNRNDYQDIYLYLGYRSPTDILFRKDFATWKKHFNVQLTVDKKHPGQFCYNATEGFITKAVEAAQLPTENTVVFICGPPVMIKFLVKILKDKGYHDDQIFISAERLMYCAMGICCHCMIRGKFTCMDGPVFRYDQIKDYKND